MERDSYAEDTGRGKVSLGGFVATPIRSNWIASPSGDPGLVVM